MQIDCPVCHTKCDVETIDNGVGEEQCAPAVCLNCNSYEYRTMDPHPIYGYWLQGELNTCNECGNPHYNDSLYTCDECEEHFCGQCIDSHIEDCIEEHSADWNDDED